MNRIIEWPQCLDCEIIEPQGGTGLRGVSNSRLHRLPDFVTKKDFGLWVWGCMQPSLRFCMHLRSRGLYGHKRSKAHMRPTDSALVCPYRRYSSGARPARTGPRYAAGLYARALHTDVRSPGRSALVVEKSLVSRRLSRAACPSCILSRNCSRKLVLRTRALPSVSKKL